MRKMIQTALVGLALAVTQPVLAQGIGHTFFMRGSVVSTQGGQTVVCVGKADGAEVGQVLEVYRVTTVPGPNKGTGSPVRRTLVGHVRVDHIFDDHFAHVSVADGRPALHDIVELRRN